MNYRHAFHAGNFADVIKHALVARVVDHLKQKDGPFRVIDTHAGAGLYDLASDEARRSGEWERGIARLWKATLPDELAHWLAPYLEAIRRQNPSGSLRYYPGSPCLVKSWLRRQDRLIACELEPVARLRLKRVLGKDSRTKAIAIDGWTALSAYIPPKERRGMVLIDPPFEDKNEMHHLASALADALQKWPTGTFLAWYPIKQAQDTATLRRALAKLSGSKVLRLETMLPVDDITKLYGSGLIVINPPWTLAQEAETFIPLLASILAQGAPTRSRVDWLSQSKA